MVFTLYPTCPSFRHCTTNICFYGGLTVCIETDVVQGSSRNTNKLLQQFLCTSAKNFMLIIGSAPVNFFYFIFLLKTKESASLAWLFLHTGRWPPCIESVPPSLPPLVDFIVYYLAECISVSSGLYSVLPS